MYIVYILQSAKNGRFYIGCTKNINKRIKLHNKGRVKSTKAYRPWKVRYKERYDNLSRARKRENQLKSWKNRARIKKLIDTGPIV